VAVSTPSFDWDPAGPDRALALARSRVAALDFGAARELLATPRSGADPDVRAFRSAVLAACAAPTRVAENWLRAEPDHPDALLLYARVAAYRALHAAAGRAELERIAVAAVREACLAAPGDPTPYAVELSLLRLRGQTLDYRPPGRPPGPPDDAAWGLWRAAEARHPGDREAGQRLLALCFPRNGGSAELASDTAAYLASVGPPQGVNRLLPLFAALERGRADGPCGPDPQRVSKIHQLLGGLADEGPAQPHAEQRRRTLLEMLDLELHGEQAADPVAEDLAREWFGPSAAPPASATVADLSVLADALHRGGRLGPAWCVLQRIHPHASAFPWSRQGPPQKVLTRVYKECRRGGRAHQQTAGARR
jgi:hypothetical protein